MSSSQQSEPPRTSSHTAETSLHIIKFPPLALVGVVLLLFGVTFPAAGWPAGLGWLFAVPFLVGAWVLRVRTTVSSRGLKARGMFTSRFVAWDDVEGIRFPDRRWARASVRGAGEITLPLVRFSRLPLLASASGGRITDPYAALAASEDTDDKQESDDRSRERVGAVQEDPDAYPGGRTDD